VRHFEELFDDGRILGKRRKANALAGITFKFLRWRQHNRHHSPMRQIMTRLKEPLKEGKWEREEVFQGHRAKDQTCERHGLGFFNNTCLASNRKEAAEFRNSPVSTSG